MNDNLELDERIRDLAGAVPPPAIPVEQDLERGRRRLRRTRWLVSGGAAAGVAAVVLGVGLVNGVMNDDDGGSPAGPATQVASDKPKPKPKSDVQEPNGAELLQDYRNVLAEHLDPSGTHLQKKPDNLQSGGGLGTKLGWTVPGQDGLGMVEVFVGPGWWGFVGADCDHGAECRTETVDGITARILEWNGTTTVLVERPDTKVAIIVDSLFGNNSVTPVEGMDIPIADLVRAAADERIIKATPDQIANANTSMGFPDLDHPNPLEQGTSTNPVPLAPAG